MRLGGRASDGGDVMTTETRTPLHDQHWQRSKAGSSLFTRWRGLHLSVYQKPNQETLRFRLDGPLPARITTTTEAIGFVWQTIVSRIGRGAA